MEIKQVRFGPTALGSAVANLLNPPTLSGGVGVPGTTTNTYYEIDHIRIVNKTGGAATFSMWIGATGASAAGTEVIGTAISVAGNAAYDWYGALTLDVADFLTAQGSASATLTFEGEGFIGIR